MIITVGVKYSHEVLDFFGAQHIAYSRQYMFHLINVETSSLRFVETRKRLLDQIGIIWFVNDFGHHVNIIIKRNLATFSWIIFFCQQNYISFVNEGTHSS